MPLTDTVLRQAKPGPKPIKLSDERGLFLLLQPSGGKLWRLKYRIDGKEKKLSLGSYPDVPLKEARRRRDEAREAIAAGIDPAEQKKRAATAIAEQARNTFASVASEYLEKASREGRAAVTIGKSRWLVSLLDPDLGARPVSSITSAELLAVLRKIEAKGHLETARRVRSFAGRVFRYADPSGMLRGALVSPTVKHHAAILEPAAVCELLRGMDGFKGLPLTQIALRLTPHVFVRPGELRRAEWDEFDLDRALWSIKPEKMKMREPHVVPLSSQSVALLESAKVAESTGLFHLIAQSALPR
jgi:integrase